MANSEPVDQPNLRAGTVLTMSTIRPFTCMDLMRFNNINFDHWTETVRYAPGRLILRTPLTPRLQQFQSDMAITQFGMKFYLEYLAKWPHYCKVMESPRGTMMAYMIGKSEGNDAYREWHAHVSAVTVAPEFR